MAQELRVYIWCDGVKAGSSGDFLPRHDPRSVEGLTRVHALDGGKPKRVDLCDPCNTDMTLAEARYCIKEFGQSPDVAGQKAPRPMPGGSTPRPGGRMAEGRTDCIWCPGNYAWTGWAGHLRTVHNLAGVKEALGKQCPACGEEFDGLSVHITRGHEEFAMVTDAFFWARDNGDPYKVWATVFAKAPYLQKAPDEVQVLL
jgi:hypothetical protein